jgi:hypothetical protein
MDYITLEFQGDTSSEFIESRLRYLAIEMLFELCRLQKLTSAQLGESHGIVSSLGRSADSVSFGGFFRCIQ